MVIKMKSCQNLNRKIGPSCRKPSNKNNNCAKLMLNGLQKNSFASLFSLLLRAYWSLLVNTCAMTTHTRIGVHWPCYIIPNNSPFPLFRLMLFSLSCSLSLSLYSFGIHFVCMEDMYYVYIFSCRFIDSFMFTSPRNYIISTMLLLCPCSSPLSKQNNVTTIDATICWWTQPLSHKHSNNNSFSNRKKENRNSNCKKLYLHLFYQVPRDHL